MTKDEKSNKFEAHLLAIADIAIKVGDKLDLKNDALQACFATILISGDKHGVFLEPVPVNVVTPAAPASEETGPAGLPAAKAEVADQIPETVTPEESEAVNRSALLKAIEDAKNLLNKAGHNPPITPKGINKVIEKKMGITGNLGSLDNEQLGELLKILSNRLDEVRHNNNGETEPSW